RFRDFHKKEGRTISLLLFMVFLFIYSSLGLLWQRTADVGIPRLWTLGINDEEYYIVAGFQLGGHFLELLHVRDRLPIHLQDHFSWSKTLQSIREGTWTDTPDSDTSRDSDLCCQLGRNIADGHPQLGGSILLWAIRVSGWLSTVHSGQHIVSIGDGNCRRCVLPIPDISDSCCAAWLAVGDVGNQVIAVLHLASIDAGDDVAWFQACLCCCKSRLNG